MIDLLVIAGYFAVMLWVGWRARGHSPEGYWVAGRRYGSLPVSASLVATIFGASSTLGIIGLGYSRGLTGAWWSLVGGIALIPFSFILAARVRGMEVYTLPDILRRAYGERVALAGALVIALAWCGVVAAQIVAGALLLGGVLSVPFHGALALVTVVFVLYTLWGGQTSVIRTDSWQVLLFAASILAALLLLLRGGFGEVGLAAALPPGFLQFPVSPDFGWYQVLVIYPLILGLPYLVGPDIYSRVFCARDGNAARRAGVTAAALVIPLSFLLALVGILIRARFPDVAPEAAFPLAVTSLAPVGLKGLIVVGVLGAIMSSADTTLMSASTILSLNVVGRWAKLDSQEQLRLTRVFVVVVGVAAWAIAAFEQGIISSLWLAYTVFVGGVALPTLGSFWRARLGISPTGALLAVVVGGVFGVLGDVRNGELLGRMVGEGGIGMLETMLGPEYGSILPLVLSALILLLVGRKWGRRSVGIAGLLALLLASCGGCSGGTEPSDLPADLCPTPGSGVSVGGTLPQENTPASPIRRLVLMGGGAEHDAAATLFAEGASGGDIVILRASGSLTSYPNYFASGLSPSPAPASAVTVLTTVPESANDPALLCWVGHAEALWLAGGSQRDYLGLWPQAVHSAIAQVTSRGGAVGGTSAGAVSLGEAAFDAGLGSVTSAMVLADPLRPEASLTYPTFAQPELHGVYVDSHFMDRDREGRLLVFLARFLDEKGRAAVAGLGLDEGVAVVIEGGLFRVFAPPGQSAWLYQVTGPATLADGAPLDLSGIHRVRLDNGAAGDWPADFGSFAADELRVEAGVITLVQ